MPGGLTSCGCAYSMRMEGRPVCARHGQHEAMPPEEVEERLADRRARCVYCAQCLNSDPYLPFFRLLPGKDQDEYYCGCRGWA